MDSRTRQVIGELTQHIARLEERLDRAERAARTPQLPNASLTNAAIRMVDADGTDRGSIGYQPDGTVAVVPVNGPPPPKPSTPAVAAGQLSLTISWDGLFAEGDDGDPATQPLDFDHVQVHLSTTSGYTPDATTLQGSLAKPGSLVITPLSDESTYYAVLVPVNTSGIAGEPSDATPGTPDAVVSGEVLDGSITTLKLADDAVTNAKIADNAVNANKLADGSVDAAAIIAGAVGSDAISASAIIAGKIAAGAVGATELAANSVIAGKIAAGVVDATALAAQAVTTAKLDALAVTSDKIAANAITAGKINSGAVTAGSIAAGAVTASTLESTLVMSTEMRSTNYVSGSAGWRIIGSGSAEFNNAVFRGDVTVGTAGHPQVHVYTSSSAGFVDIPTGDAAENLPARIVGGTVGTGASRQLSTFMSGPRVNSSLSAAGIIFDSQSVDLSSFKTGVRISEFGSDGSVLSYMVMNSNAVTANTPLNAAGPGSDGDTILFLGPQPTATGAWTAYTGTTWSQLPLSVTCPPSESMRISIRTVMSNRSSTASSIGIGVRVRDATTGTNLRVPSSADPYDGASVSATGAVLTADQPDTWVAYAGFNLLHGRAGHTIEFLPYYRLSSATGTVSVQANRTSITVECLVNRVVNGTI